MGRLEAQGGCSLRCGGQPRPRRERDSWAKTWRWTREETTWLHLCVKVPQSCPTLCNPMDYTVHGILQNTGAGSLSLLQGIFPTRGSNLGLLHCRWILYLLSHQGSPLGSMQREYSRQRKQQVQRPWAWQNSKGPASVEAGGGEPGFVGPCMPVEACWLFLWPKWEALGGGRRRSAVDCFSFKGLLWLLCVENRLQGGKGKSSEMSYEAITVTGHQKMVSVYSPCISCHGYCVQTLGQEAILVYFSVCIFFSPLVVQILHRREGAKSMTSFFFFFGHYW